MSLLDHLRSDYLRGKVIDKYRLPDGNIGLIIDADGIGKRYHVRFVDDYRNQPCIDNLFGLLKDPFSGKTEYLDKLINKGDYIELTASYSKSPFLEAYRIHSVASRKPENNARSFTRLPYRTLYRSSKTQGY